MIDADLAILQSASLVPNLAKWQNVFCDYFAYSSVAILPMFLFFHGFMCHLSKQFSDSLPTYLLNTFVGFDF